MNKVYAVGVLLLDLSVNAQRIIQSKRLWYLYSKFEDAEACVLENKSDIFEFYYNCALIEEVYVIPVDPNDMAPMPRQWWYAAEYSDLSNDGPIIFKTDVPKSFLSICSFWIG